jgi:hypothetical protein
MTAPAGEKVPGEQLAQEEADVAAVTSEYVPAGQEVHEVAPLVA